MNKFYYESLNIWYAIIGLLILMIILISYRYNRKKINANMEAKWMKKVRKRNQIKK